MRFFRFVLITVFLLIPVAMQAQRISQTLALDDEVDLMIDSTAVDSVHRTTQRKLLPDNMSFMERGLWGEHGFVRNIGLASPLTPEVRKHELSVRRTMLTMHQIGGFVTLGLMGTAVYFGQKTIDNPGNRSYRSMHGDFVAATIMSYGLTGLLAVLTPPPLIRRDEFSTTTLHKTLAWIHFAGMVLTPILGPSLHHGMSYSQQARFHQISAYITTATLAASLIIITF
jgi:hypothetical protein